MIRTYLDGVLDVEAPYSGLINTSTYPIQIAGTPNNSRPAKLPADNGMAFWTKSGCTTMPSARRTSVR